MPPNEPPKELLSRSNPVAIDAQIERNESGYKAVGPGFYVWDESLDQVIDSVRTLTQRTD